MKQDLKEIVNIPDIGIAIEMKKQTKGGGIIFQYLNHNKGVAEIKNKIQKDLGGAYEVKEKSWNSKEWMR